MERRRVHRWLQIADTAMAAVMLAFFAITGWMFAQIMFPTQQYMVPVTIFIVHMVYVSYYCITGWRATTA